MKVAFLDRDGTIIKDYPDSLWSKVEEPEILNGSIQGLSDLIKMGYQLILITNQYIIEEGFITLEHYKRLNSKLLNQLKEEGIELLDVFYCPHSRNSGCFCCKPQRGMIDQALMKYPEIDLKDSILIGDSESDEELAKRINIPFYGIKRGVRRLENLGEIKDMLRKNNKFKLDNHDSRIRFYKLKLHRDNFDNIPEYSLPAGYRFVFYTDGDRDEWIKIEKSAKEFITYEEGLQAWNKYFAPWENELSERMIFIENEVGEKVATASAYFDIHGIDPVDSGRLHWVAVRKEDQGKGLSKPLISYTLNVLKGLGYSHSYLSTQTTSWVACKIYMDFGFVPEEENLKESYEGWCIVKTLTNHSVLLNVNETDRIFKSPGGSSR